MRKTSISVCISDEMRKELDLIAINKAWSLSLVVNRALEQYIKNEKEKNTNRIAGVNS